MFSGPPNFDDPMQMFEFTQAILGGYEPPHQMAETLAKQISSPPKNERSERIADHVAQGGPVQVAIPAMADGFVIYEIVQDVVASGVDLDRVTFTQSQKEITRITCGGVDLWAE